MLRFEKIIANFFTILQKLTPLIALSNIFFLILSDIYAFGLYRNVPDSISESLREIAH